MQHGDLLTSSFNIRRLVTITVTVTGGLECSCLRGSATAPWSQQRLRCNEMWQFCFYHQQKFLPQQINKKTKYSFLDANVWLRNWIQERTSKEQNPKNGKNKGRGQKQKHSSSGGSSAREILAQSKAILKERWKTHLFNAHSRISAWLDLLSNRRSL